MNIFMSTADQNRNTPGGRQENRGGGRRDSHLRGRDKREKDFDHSLLHVARVARVVQGGRRFSFRATVAIGDRKGKVGVGVAKGSDVSTAIGKAIHDAKKDLVSFPIISETIPYEVEARYKGAKIIIKPARIGKGIVAGGSLRVIAELGGIKNLTAKSLGSSNKINTAKAMLGALKAMRSKRASTPIEFENKEMEKAEKLEEQKKTQESLEKEEGVKVSPEITEKAKSAPAKATTIKK